MPTEIFIREPIPLKSRTIFFFKAKHLSSKHARYSRFAYYCYFVGFVIYFATCLVYDLVFEPFFLVLGLGGGGQKERVDIYLYTKKAI